MIEKIKQKMRIVYVPISNHFYKKFKAPKRYQALFDEIAMIKASSILEVGTWNGRRAIKMINCAQENAVGKVRYIGFDLFEDLTQEMFKYELSKMPPTQEGVTKLLEQTGAQVTLVKGNTLQTLPEFVRNSGQVDFIFIDGGHSVETIQSDWDAVSKLMHKETVVIFDDYWRNRPDESAKPVVDAIDTDKYNVEVLPIVDKFNNPNFGRLEISFAKVTLNKESV